MRRLLDTYGRLEKERCRVCSEPDWSDVDDTYLARGQVDDQHDEVLRRTLEKYGCCAIRT